MECARLIAIVVLPSPGTEEVTVESFGPLKFLCEEAAEAAEDSADESAAEEAGDQVETWMRVAQIYEGTSEIMEWTIARDRWQEHLKTRGQYYHQLAAEAEDETGRPRQPGTPELPDQPPPVVPPDWPEDEPEDGEPEGGGPGE